MLRELRRHDVKLPKRDDSGQLVWRLATRTIVNSAGPPAVRRRPIRGDVANP